MSGKNFVLLILTVSNECRPSLGRNDDWDHVNHHMDRFSTLTVTPLEFLLKRLLFIMTLIFLEYCTARERFSLTGSNIRNLVEWVDSAENNLLVFLDTFNNIFTSWQKNELNFFFFQITSS